MLFFDRLQHTRTRQEAARVFCGTCNYTLTVSDWLTVSLRASSPDLAEALATFSWKASSNMQKESKDLENAHHRSSLRKKFT